MEKNADAGRNAGYALPVGMAVVVVILLALLLLPGQAAGQEREVGIAGSERMEGVYAILEDQPPMIGTLIPTPDTRLWGGIAYVTVSVADGNYICYALLVSMNIQEMEFSYTLCYTTHPRIQSVFELAMANKGPIELWGKETDPPGGPTRQAYPLYEISRARFIDKDFIPLLK